MARLDELSSMKTEILTRLISNQDICKAVYYNEEDFLDQPEVDNPHSLIYSNIFPYQVIRDLVDETKTYINLSFNNFQQINNSFKRGFITFSVVTHIDIVRTSYGFLRYDFIANKIDEMMNQERGFGLGRLQFNEFNEFVVKDKFIGLYLRYVPVDFN